MLGFMQMLALVSEGYSMWELFRGPPKVVGFFLVSL